MYFRNVFFHGEHERAGSFKGKAWPLGTSAQLGVVM